MEERTYVPVCPYCGHEDKDWWDGCESLHGDGDTEEFFCGTCDQEYNVTMHMSISFSTKKIEEQ